MNQTNELLNQLQADATVFYQKVRAFHWTVTGERFFQLHAHFEQTYTRWAEHIDAIAERVVMNGGTPLLSLAAIISRAKVKDTKGGVDDRAMVEAVAADLTGLIDVVSQGAKAAEADGCRATVNLLDSIREQEEKALWMLKATLQ